MPVITNFPQILKYLLPATGTNGHIAAEAEHSLSPEGSRQGKESTQVLTRERQRPSVTRGSALSLFAF